MDEKRIDRINLLFDKLMDRVEHEVDAEEHEINDDIVNAVLMLREYKDHLVSRTESSKGAQAIIAAITRNMNRGGKGEH